MGNIYYLNFPSKYRLSKVTSSTVLTSSGTRLDELFWNSYKDLLNKNSGTSFCVKIFGQVSSTKKCLSPHLQNGVDPVKGGVDKMCTDNIIMYCEKWYKRNEIKTHVCRTQRMSSSLPLILGQSYSRIRRYVADTLTDMAVDPWAQILSLLKSAFRHLHTQNKTKTVA